MRTTQKLTDAFLRSLLAKPAERDKRITDPACTGLRIRLRPNRSPQWEHVFTVDGKTRFQSLGSYPEVLLADARASVERRRRELVQGHVPDSPTAAQKQAREEERAAAEKRITVEKMFTRWFKLEIEKKHRDDGALVRGHFARHVLPKIGSRVADDVDRTDIFEIYDAIRGAGSLRAADVVLQLLKRLFAFGAERKLVTANHAAVVRRQSAGGSESGRGRYLSPPEIQELAQKLPKSGVTKASQSAIWVLMSTLVRVGALYETKWSDVDLDLNSKQPVWRAWDQKKKGKRVQYDVPLSRFARWHFREIRRLQMELEVTSEWVMHSRVSPEGADLPAHRSTLNKQIQDRQEENKRKGRSSSTALLLKGGRWTVHDLRRTGASRMQNMSIPAEVRRACMNHIPGNRLEQIYDRDEIPLGDRRKAFQKLSDDLERLTSHDGITSEAALMGRAADSRGK